ncbi:MAG TPA: DUF4382 domain-containing protein [Vicinamibacterales bacterium]|nr:DUF4382 domain-containing protein [Vicinamibacterales bacterium]
MRVFRQSLVIAGVLLGAGLLACGGDSPVAPSGSSNPTSSSGAGTASAAKGQVTIKMTDSPFSDAQAVLVTFSGVSIHAADPGEWRTLAFADGGASRTCDLKKLQGPVDVLGVGTLGAGHYTQIRLQVSSAAIYFENPTTGDACAPTMAAPAGLSAPVTVSSGEVKLNRQFTVPAGGATTITLDFDGDKSITKTGSSNGKGKSTAKYMLKPVVGVVSVQ